MRRTKEEALGTKERILDCAEKVFVGKGVAKTSLADIATAAGVTRGAIYGHFTNKTDLFNAMVARVKLPMDALFEAANHPRAEDPMAVLHDAMCACMRNVAEDEHTRHVFSILLMNHDSEDWLRERNGAESINARALLTRSLRSAMRKGQLPNDLDIHRGAALLKAMLVGVLRDWLIDPAAFSLPADAQSLTHAILDMLRFSQALRKPST